MAEALTKPSIAEEFCTWATSASEADIPPDVRRTIGRTVLDAGGIIVAARNTDYIASALASADGSGNSTAIGHDGAFTVADASLINGIAAHGEDFDDTFEGTPVHVGAVLVPSLLAAGEAYHIAGPDLLRGLAIGGELACRLGVVAPMAIHRAAFHPTAVVGALGAAAGVSAALRLDQKQMVHALGIAASMASGIIEYLAEGTWTKRLHPGWAAQAGVKAARLAQNGFTGPRSVFEGVHGFFVAFASPDIERDYSRITTGLGEEWYVSRLAFKPYACGTMIQPYIDCAIKLREQGVLAEDVKAVVAKVGEGTVHRLWEPVAEKALPSTPYSAKFSGPYGVAIGLLDGGAGLAQYTEHSILRGDIRDLSAKIRYEIDPDNPYPENYTGELDVALRDGSRLTVTQPHLRGGTKEPLGDDEILRKFKANTAFGGWDEAKSAAFVDFSSSLFEGSRIAGLSAFRG